MAGFWDDYLARKRKQEEEEEARKRVAEAETAEDGDGDSLSFWAGYQRQKRTGESAPVPAEEEESLSLTDRLAARGIAVDPVARHGTNAQGQTAISEDTSRTLAALSGNGKTGANLFTDRIGSTFTAAQAQRDKLAAQAEEERKDQTVRNQEWLDALRSPEEIQAELDEAKAEKRGNLWNEIVRRLTNAVNAGNVAVPTVERDEAGDKAADERVRSLTDELAQRQWADYERLRNNADFEEKSRYKSTANGKETKLNPMGGYDSVGFDDPLYEYVNGNEDAGRILAMEKEEAGRQNGLLGFLVPEDTYNYEQVSEMTEEERKLYNYIHETKGSKAAYEYFDYLRSDLYARQMEREKNEAAAYAAEHPILSTIGSIGISPLRGAAYLGQAAQFLTEGEIDQNAPYNRIAALPAAERETVTRTVERNWGKAGSFAYGVGVSMAEFLLNSGISGGNEALSLALMGAGAASDATIEAKERGLADWQSFALGTIAGAAEIITEKVSVEKLFSDPGGRPWKYLLQNIFAEGSEEAASDVINLVTDVLITQDKSEWMQSVREYQKNNPGMSEDEAFVQVMKDQGLQILYDAAAGAASGGIMAMPGSIRAFAQLSQDRSQRIEAGRQAVQAKRSQEQEGGGRIVLPTAEEATDTGDVIRTGTESDSTNPLRTLDEAEVDERVAKARNITEATGIRYGVDQKEIRRAERLSRITGQEVEFYSHEAENGVVENGHMDPVTGKIWLNAKGKNPLQVTLGHEFTHSLEGTDAYRELVDLAKTQTAEAGGDWAAKADRYARLYEAHGDRVSAEMLDQELTADFVGETLFTDERAIREMFRENPSLGKRVRDAIDNFIVRASDMGGIMSPVDEQKFRNVLKIYDRYVRAADRDETAQEARGGAQAGEVVQTGSRQGEGQNVQKTAATETKTKVEDISAAVNLGEASGTAETADQIRVRAEDLYDAGEIDETRYADMQALADELESTGQSLDRSTVERDEGPRGKLGEIADRVRGRYSLSEDQREQVESPAFMRWFGDWRNDPENASKVMNEDGTPKIVYHGTPNGGFTVFDSERIGNNTNRFVSDVGFYFTNDPYVAKNYQNYNGVSQNGETKAVYLDIKKPLVLEDEGWGSAVSQTDIRHESIIRWLEEGDYDGVIVRSTDEIIEVDGHEEPDTVYIVRDPAQIKSATDNIGTFDRKNPDIRYSLAAEAERADADYMAAVEAGDMETAQRMVEAAAEYAMPDSRIRTPDGKLRRVYHGTNSGDFTVFDKGLIGKAREGDVGFFGRGFYFTFHQGEASVYGRRIIPAYLNIRNPFNFETELNSYNGERSYDYMGSRALFAINWAEKFPELAGNHTVKVSERGGDRVREISLGELAEVFKDVYDNQEFVVEKDPDEDNLWVVMSDRVNDSYTDAEGIEHPYSYYDYEQKVYGEKAAKSKVNQVLDYLNGGRFDYFHVPSSVDIVQESDLSNTLMQRGYDGVIQSEEGDEIVAFDNTQIKSADPVTYDDDGNVIPLSQRFNSEEDDIRYSVSEAEQETTEIAGGDLNSYPYDTRKVIKGYIEAVDEDLLDFVNRVNEGEKTPFMIRLGRVSEELGAAVEAAVGINPANGENRLPADTVRHIERRHGTNGIQDQSMRHPEDIARIQFVLDNFDSVQSTGRITKADRNRDKTFARTVEISKKIDGTYYIIEAVPDTRNNRMTIVSAYIEKSRNTVGADAEAPGGTSETNATPVPADNIVSQDRNDVNGGEERFSLSEEQGRPTLKLPNGVETTGRDEYNQMDRSEIGYRLMEYEFDINRVLDMHDGTLSETEEAMADNLRESLDQMANTSDAAELWRAYQHFRTAYQGIQGWYFNDEFRADIMREIEPSDVEDLYHSKMIQLQGDGVRYSLSEEQEEQNSQNELAGLSQKAKAAALRIERQFASDVLQGIQRTLNPNSAEYRQFRADVARPVTEALLRGEEADPDAVLESTGIDILGQAAARGAVIDAIRKASGEIGRIRTAVQQANARQQAREARNAEIDARIPDTTEGLEELANRSKDAKKRLNSMRARTLMTDEDLDLAHKIATGQITPEEAFAQNALGMDDIINMADAEREYLEANAPWERYTKRLAQQRFETADKHLQNADRAKDKASGFQYARETPERNFRDVFGSDAAALIDTYIRPIHKAEAASTRFKNEYNKRVKDLNLSQKIRRGNANSEAAAVQFLGEAEDNVRVLELARSQNAVRDGKTLNEWMNEIQAFMNANPNLDYDKVHQGIEAFQQIYKELISEMNRVLVENGYMPVNVRRGYFPHFNGGSDGVLATFASLLGINIDTNALPTAINGLTSMFKPGKPWFSHAMERTGFQTDYDALEGFAGYLGGVSDVIHQTPNIRNLRALGTRIRYMMGDEQIKRRIDEINADDSRSEQEKLAAITDLTDNGRYKLSRFVSWLDEYTNQLANKKSKYDRGIEDLMGRRVYTWMKNIEGRVAANMISGNLGSALTNFIPLNQAGAVLGDFSMLRGAFDTMAGRARGDGFMERSDFLTNRRGVNPLFQTTAQKISDALSKPMNIIDDFTSETIVRAAYGKYIRQGLDEQSAMQAADELAAGLMADRSKGATPTIFGSHNPLTKLFTQFQVEVNNEFSTIFKDIPKGAFKDDKDKRNAVAYTAMVLLRYFIGAYLFNDLYEKIVGRRAALDPVDLLNDAVGDLSGRKLNNVFDMISDGVIDEQQRANPSEAITNFGTNALEELPFVGGLLGGGRIPISSALPDAETIVKGLTNEKWSGAKKAETVGREFGKTVGTYILPPFAGGAGKKLYQTAENTLRGGRYVKDAEGNDQLQYPYFTDTPLETAGTVLQSALFGPTATEGGKDWVEGGFGNQTAKNTELYKRLTQEMGENQRASWDFISGLTGLDPLGKRVAVAESGLSDEGKAEAMSAVVSDSERYKFRAAYENGVSADAWTGFWRTLPSYDEDGNGSYKQAEVTAALDNARVPLSAGEGAAQGLFGGDTETRSLTRAEKAAIWSAYNPKWKVANNPFDASIGDRVVSRIGQMQDEESDE